MLLKILQNSQENTCLKPLNFIKKRLQLRRFPLKFPRTPFLKEHLRWLLRLVETLRLHVNLLLMFGLGEKFRLGVLVYMLLSLFSVENNVIKNIWKKEYYKGRNFEIFFNFLSVKEFQVSQRQKLIS